MSEYRVSNADIADVLPLYERWVKGGKLPYMRNYERNGKAQFFYDTYHNHIAEIGKGLYEFNFQTSDSPEGDTWVRGKFKVDEYGVKILEQRCYGA